MTLAWLVSTGGACGRAPLEKTKLCKYIYK